MLKKAMILFAIGLTLILGFGGFSYYQSYTRNSVILTNETINRVILKAIPKYKRAWSEAPSSFVCDYLKEIGDVDSNYLINNPDYFECFLAKVKVQVKYQGKKYSVRAKKSKNGLHYRVITNSTSTHYIYPNYALQIELFVTELKGKTLTFLFEDTFHEAYLPQRVYGVGDFKRFDDFRWDNFGRHFLIDKYLVTYRDVLEWKIFSPDRSVTKDLTLPSGKKDRVKPATNLTLKQMESYCAFRGKTLLKNYIYDAMAYRPVNLDNPKPLKVVRGPYPWTYHRKHTLLEQNEMDQEICNKVYTKDCAQIAGYEFYDTLASSWIGTYQILGGYPEYIYNLTEPKENLKASSVYFDHKSPWHDIGKKAYWSGEDLNPKSFDWGKHSPEDDYDNFKVGFRCMREVFSE